MSPGNPGSDDGGPTLEQQVDGGRELERSHVEAVELRKTELESGAHRAERVNRLEEETSAAFGRESCPRVWVAQPDFTFARVERIHAPTSEGADVVDGAAPRLEKDAGVA